MPQIFDDRARAALNSALIYAEELGSQQIGTEHLLLALCADKDSSSARLLNGEGITFAAIKSRLYKGRSSLSKTSIPAGSLSPALRCIIEKSATEASGRTPICDEHLLRAIIADRDNAACRTLVAMGADVERLYITMVTSYGSAEAAGRLSAAVLKFGCDLTARAAAGELDPVLGREAEIERVIRILCRRTKNNPCLVGEAGVGKTAIVEGLARRICEGTAPYALRNKRIFALDLSSMVAGAKYRGEFEDRLKNVLRELSGSGTIIFIDELHTIVGAGSAEGSIDAAGILKPVLARSGIQLIGATTFDEYSRHIESDCALSRRFQPVRVEEPSVSDCIEILRGLRNRYETFHRIKISDAALEASVRLSSRHLPDRRLPDKAIDLIDEAAAELGLRGTPRSECTLTAEHVAATLSQQTGVPLSAITKSEREILFSLEDKLKESVLGQDKAVMALCCAVRRGRAGLSDGARPVGSFMFCGPTGVGKTALARALAGALYGENGFLRFDMSEYMEAHSVSRLIGTPPGYVGYEQSGLLVSAVRKRPYSVVLFDELEKAHPDIYGILLQILEEGVLTDSHGRKADFKNTIIIMTTNAGDGKSAPGFLPQGGATAAEKTYRAELLNRIDEIINFSALSHETLCKIARIKLLELAEKLRELGVDLRIDLEAAAAYAASAPGSARYGARPLRRRIEKEIVTPISNLLLCESPPEELSVSIEEGIVTVCQPQRVLG